jgi:mannosyl-3-phosphoglycerate phosphatase
MEIRTSLIVFTDLDGTLLDHDDYSWAAAKDALSRLFKNKIPLIAVSSKTLAELKAINAQSNLFTGLIGENGGVVDIAGQHRDLGPTAELIDRIRAEIADRVAIPVAGFRTSSAEKIAHETGLPIEDAKRAGDRHCSDPLIWHPEEKDLRIARQIAEENGIRLVRGGRFHTLCGETDKGAAMQAALEILQETGALPDDRSSITIVALGDSPNDTAMLAAADIAVQIPPKHGSAPVLNLGTRPVRVADAPGPEGWNAMVNSILDEYAPTALQGGGK